MIVKYLTESRELEKNLVMEWIVRGDIYEEKKHHNVVFVGRDADGIPRYIEPFNVIYQTAEDGKGDTIKPRLIEAGADLSRVMVIDDTEEALTLSDDRIEKAVRQNHVRLVIIDPVQAFIGADVDMNRANEVRPVFRREDRMCHCDDRTSE